MRQVKITKKFLDNVEIPMKGKAVIYKDTELSGFGVKVTPTKKVFIAEKVIDKKRTRKVFAEYPEVNVFQAREEAIKLLARITSGESIDDNKYETVEEKVTLEELFDQYIEAKRLKPKTISSYKDAVNLHLNDWRYKPLKKITRQMILDRHSILSKHSKSMTNQAFRVIRSLFNFADAKYKKEDGDSMFRNNPVDILTELKLWHKIKRRQTVVTEDDLSLWYKTLFEVEVRSTNNNEVIRDYLIFILFTGLRKTEASTLRWNQIDFRKKILTLSDTKNNTEHQLPLPEHLMKLLKRRRERGGKGRDWVFLDVKGESYVKEPKYFIQRVIKQCDVNFTVHDLRRTFITIAESLDIPFYALKRLLNHSQERDVTAGYIVDGVERLREPMERISQRILELTK